MKRPIIEAKGKGYALVIVGLAFAVLGIVLFALCADTIEYSDDIIDQIVNIVPFIIIFGAGVWMLTLGISMFQTKVYVFEGHIEGKCMINKRICDFYLHYDKISSISTEKTVLMIQSDGITHKINLPAEQTSKIARYINDKI